MEGQSQIVPVAENPACQPAAASGANGPIPTAHAPDKPGTPKPISDLVLDPDFPKNAIGKTVDIGGFVGLVVDFVKHSIKVRSSQGNTVSYNVNTLRKLYGPPPPPPPEPEPPKAAAPITPPSAPKPPTIDPDFSQPTKLIEEYTNRSDYPDCVLGQHLDVHGYVGVVIQIVGRSLKVRSREGSTRSYNADGLRNLYGKGAK